MKPVAPARFAAQPSAVTLEVAQPSTMARGQVSLGAATDRGLRVVRGAFAPKPGVRDLLTHPFTVLRTISFVEVDQ